jgi:hypothetical protein
VTHKVVALSQKISWEGYTDRGIAVWVIYLDNILTVYVGDTTEERVAYRVEDDGITCMTDMLAMVEEHINVSEVFDD